MRHPIPARAAGILLVAAVAVAGLGCRETTIARILAEPERYVREGDVGLQGDVVESVSFLGRGAFRLDDGTGTIWIISSRGVPRKGARVAVKGRIRDVADVSTLIRLPDPIGSGLVMTDAEYRAR
jgi:hypothetical protein